MTYVPHRVSGIDQITRSNTQRGRLGAFKAVTGFDTYEQFYKSVQGHERHRITKTVSYKPYWEVKDPAEYGIMVAKLHPASVRKWEKSLIKEGWKETDIEGLV